MNRKSATMFAWQASPSRRKTVFHRSLSSTLDGTGWPQTQAPVKDGLFVFLNRISGSHVRRWRMTPGYWPGGLSAVKVGQCNHKVISPAAGSADARKRRIVRGNPIARHLPDMEKTSNATAVSTLRCETTDREQEGTSQGKPGKGLLRFTPSLKQ